MEMHRIDRAPAYVRINAINGMIGPDRRLLDRTAEAGDVAQLEGLLSRLQLSTGGTGNVALDRN